MERSANKKTDMFYGAPPISHQRAKELRKCLTPTELIMWTRLSNRKTRVKFRRQHPINKFIVDFYCHELKLVIEIDGEVHAQKERIEYDLSRTKVLNNYDIKILRFTNHQIYRYLDDVMQEIRTTIETLKTEDSENPR